MATGAGSQSILLAIQTGRLVRHVQSPRVRMRELQEYLLPEAPSTIESLERAVDVGGTG